MPTIQLADKATLDFIKAVTEKINANVFNPFEYEAYSAHIDSTTFKPTAVPDYTSYSTLLSVTGEGVLTGLQYESTGECANMMLSIIADGHEFNMSLYYFNSNYGGYINQFIGFKESLVVKSKLSVSGNRVRPYLGIHYLKKKTT